MDWNKTQHLNIDTEQNDALQQWYQTRKSQFSVGTRTITSLTRFSSCTFIREPASVPVPGFQGQICSGK